MNFANGAVTTLSGNITAGAGNLTVADASRFPATPFHICIDSELMTVTANLGGLFTVTRGIEGTTAAAHASGALVTNTVTAGDFAGFLSALPADVAKTDVANTFTISPQTIVCDADNHAGVIVKVHSATQTADAYQLLDSGGTELFGTLFPNAVSDNGVTTGHSPALFFQRSNTAVQGFFFLSGNGNRFYLSRDLYVNGQLSLQNPLLVGAGFEIKSSTGDPVKLRAAPNNSNHASANVIIDTNGVVATVSPLVSIRNNGTEKAYLSGEGNWFLANVTTDPPATPTGGGIIYVAGGALKYVGSSGTVTTLALA